MNKSVSDRELADWVLQTCRLFGATEATAHKVAVLFLESLAGA